VDLVVVLVLAILEALELRTKVTLEEMEQLAQTTTPMLAAGAQGVLEEMPQLKTEVMVVLVLPRQLQGHL
jgi:hypothetical protein